MRFTSSDPDIETLYRRISDKLLDLQPDFQRGEVWGKSKQQRLIDTILRGWHVPPIHVIQHDDSDIHEILDGKQRLTAIFDFMNNEFTIDGYIEPLTDEILELHGQRFNELPVSVRQRLMRTPIRQLLIYDFTPEEPGELFFRLNSPTYLTAAEQRNAYYGEPRKQIKKLVSMMEESGIEKEFIGFSNSRMAYDDVLARVCFVFEMGSLHKRITSKELSDRYRSSEPFPQTLINQLEMVIHGFGQVRGVSESLFRFNKATLFSWFVFLLVAQKKFGGKIDSNLQGEILLSLGKLRSNYVIKTNNFNDSENKPDFLEDLFAVFEDRSRARVANVDSVLIRDIMLWLIFLSSRSNIDIQDDDRLMNLRNKIDSLIKRKVSSISSAEKFFYDVIEGENWGVVL